MPIYDYRCDHCGHAFSAVRSFSDPVIDVCPNCGKAPRRLIGPPAIVFKGSGWYKTDSRSAPAEAGGAARPAGATTAAAGSATTAANADAKAATKKAETTAEAKPATGTAPDKKAAS